MTKLLTTKEVQKLLHVDRSTIYRMVEAGHLPGVKVGKQWRFPEDQIDNWLHGQAATPVSLSVADVIVQDQDFASTLPLTCVQLIQDAFAEALDVMIVITDMAGKPVTRVSNPCGLFKLISQNRDALQHCIAGWGEMASRLDLEPKLTVGHMGLLGTRGLVRSGTSLKGMVFIGGIAPDTWPPSQAEVEALAAELELSPERLAPHLQAVFHLTEKQRALVVSQVQRLADIMAHIVAERTALTGKLESIAKLVTFS